jgi:hypothetical protein
MSAAAEKQPEIFLKTIEVEINDAESQKLLQDHLELELQIDAVRASRASEMAEYNSRLKELRQRRGELINSIHTKKEKRDVAVYNEADERRGIMLTKRADNHVVVDERALTLDERQGKFPFQEPGKDGATGESDAGEKAEADAAGAAAEAGDGASREDAAIQAQSDAAAAKGKAGKVVRIKASDVQKKKAARAAKDKGGK